MRYYETITVRSFKPPKKSKVKMKYEKGKIYKVLGFVVRGGSAQPTGEYLLVECEESHESDLIGTILVTMGDWSEGTQPGKAHFTPVKKAYVFAESRQEYIEKHPDLLPVKEVIKEVIKEVEIEVPVKIYEWKDTFWDRLYNEYCRRKGRSNSEFV